MTKRNGISIGLVLIATWAAGCSSADTIQPTPSAVAASTSAVPDPQSAEALETTARELNTLVHAGHAEGALAMYSQRCQSKVSPETFKMMLDLNYEGRNPQITDVTVKVNGSSGQVVTVDSDPAAPADAMNPRTWTFIDGRWQFDNC